MRENSKIVKGLPLSLNLAVHIRSRQLETDNTNSGAFSDVLKWHILDSSIRSITENKFFLMNIFNEKKIF